MFRELILERLKACDELRCAIHDGFCEALVVGGVSLAEFSQCEKDGENVVRGMLQFAKLIEQGGGVLRGDCLLTGG